MIDVSSAKDFHVSRGRAISQLPGDRVPQTRDILKRAIVRRALIILRSQISCSIVSIRSGSEWAANLLFFWQQRRLKLLGRIVAANGTAATSRLPLAA